ncbi:hypothetical protein DFH28DRAFT_886262 [Melampsora americana]|nr:hypothetical protein DFH28DRAFT_886262 [Melampsora americana]
MPPFTRNRRGLGASESSNQAPSGPNQSARASEKAGSTHPSKRPPPRKTPAAKRTRTNLQNDTTNTSTRGPSASRENNNEESTSRSNETQRPNRVDAEVTPTLENYRGLMSSWPPGCIQKHLRENKALNHNRPSSDIRNRIKLVYNVFKQELLMLAMIAQVSEATIKSYIPEVAAMRKASAYTLFLKYSLDCLAEPMPLKAQDDGDSVLGLRNQRNGDRWENLSVDEREIFHPMNFYALAGVPNPLDFESDEENKDDEEEVEEERGDSFVPVPTVHKLTIEEDELYRPIYERMVDLKKVSSEMEKPSSTGPSNSQVQRKSKAAIEKISHQLACEANRLDFAYYLVATSTVTPNESKELGWLKEFTTHPQVATWANDKLNLAAVFATYSQGESMAKAIASTRPKPKRIRSNKLQPSDQIKTDLGRLLAGLTYKTLRYLPNQSFPQTADPVAELKKRSLPVEVIIAEGSRLTEETLKVGYKKMKSATRLDWINDIKDGHFQLVEVRVGSEERIGEPVVLNSKEIDIALTTPAREINKAMKVDEIAESQGAGNEAKENERGSGSSSEEDSDSE